ncbi:hypothetical protein [Marinobacter mobilis]|uniref:hypothetical protein n=1 Tax=Marinobacter mobilis TaxID=488533 RepID=UPI0035C6A6E5
MMSLSQPESARHTKPNPALNVLGTVLLIVGLVALFVPSTIQPLLPPELAGLLVEHAKLLIGLGIALQVIATLTRFKKIIRGGYRLGQQQQAAGPHQPDKGEDVDWTPLKAGGANFRTHHLVRVSPSRLEVRPSIQMMLFCLLFMALGAGVGGVFVVTGIRDGNLMTAVIPGLVGLVFLLTGALLLKSASKRRVFDLSLGGYWRGSGRLNGPQALVTQAEWAWLQEIKAIQLLQERVTSRSDNGRSRSYWSYELNLVLIDGRRLNVMDHGNPGRIRQDAEVIGQFLGVPVLDPFRPSP